MNKKKICICGGGSLGTVCAGVFLSKNYNVNLLTGHPLEWNHQIIVKDSKGIEFSGKLNKISRNPQEVIVGSDIILLCLPGFLIEQTLNDIRPFITESTLVGSIVSSTGFFFKAHKIFGQYQPLFGFHRVPFISRYNKYGHSAELLGYKKSLKVAVENYDINQIKPILEDLFITPVETTENFLEVTLSNSNPILHTGRLYSLWNNYQGSGYSEPIRFYSEWTTEASDIVLKMDNEFITLRDHLNITDTNVPSLLSYYDINTPEEFTNKIKSISAFQNIIAPMIKKDSHWYPDFQSRYFTEDFPFGLKLIKDLCFKEGINTPTIDKVYQWGLSVLKVGVV